MKVSDLGLNHSQQLILTGALGLLGTVTYAFQKKPEIWIPTAYESAVISGIAVVWTLLPKDESEQEIKMESVSKPEKQVIPSFRL